MKNAAYNLFAAIFNVSAALVPCGKKTVALLSPHTANFTDSLGEIEKEFERRGGYRLYKISGLHVKPQASSKVTKTVKSLVKTASFFLLGASRLARSKYIFMNDNFMPMSQLKFRRGVVITQLWHAEGAFKKFGLDLTLPQDVRERVENGNKKLSYVVCSSPDIAQIYARAFGVPLEKMLPVGSPRADRYLREAKSGSFDAAAFRKKYFGGTEKTTVLYAPTFRDDAKDNSELLTHFDFERFERELGDSFTLVLRLHPQIHEGISVPDGVIDMTLYPSANELIQASDILITDYSSICMDFALLGKPCVFYAFDLDRYGSERQFYCEYEQYVPGAVARNFDSLISALKNVSADSERLERFVRMNFGDNGGDSAKKIVDTVLK